MQIAVAEVFRLPLSIITSIILPFIKFIHNKQNKKEIIISVGEHNLTVEVADTISKRSMGLMYRNNLEANEGMLFVFNKPRYVSFWMKNVKIPLSVAFIDKYFIINEILNLEPFDLKPKKSKTKICYALEVNKGWFLRNNIKTGDKIRF